jgi:hypothetical protein
MAKSKEAIALLRKSDTFSSMERMKEIIDQYGPIVRELYKFKSE